MTAPHRTHAGPVLPCRPALTWWQRALVRVLATWCSDWRWYRAHVGGRWARIGWWRAVDSCPGAAPLVLAQVTGASGSVLLAAIVHHDEHRARCTCEVYPYPALCGRDEVM